MPTCSHFNVCLLIPTPFYSLWLSEELKRVTQSLHGVFQTLSLAHITLANLPFQRFLCGPLKRSVFPALTVCSCHRRPCWMGAASMGLEGEAPVALEL